MSQSLQSAFEGFLLRAQQEWRKLTPILCNSATLVLPVQTWIFAWCGIGVPVNNDSSLVYFTALQVLCNLCCTRPLHLYMFVSSCIIKETYLKMIMQRDLFVLCQMAKHESSHGAPVNNASSLVQQGLHNPDKTFALASISYCVRDFQNIPQNNHTNTSIRINRPYRFHMARFSNFLFWQINSLTSWLK